MEKLFLKEKKREIMNFHLLHKRAELSSGSQPANYASMNNYFLISFLRENSKKKIVEHVKHTKNFKND